MQGQQNFKVCNAVYKGWSLAHILNHNNPTHSVTVIIQLDIFLHLYLGFLRVLSRSGGFKPETFRTHLVSSLRASTPSNLRLLDVTEQIFCGKYIIKVLLMKSFPIPC